MTRFGGVASVSALCALLLSVIAATNAWGSTTAFTCASTGGGAGFNDAHCLNAVGSGASFGHVAVALNQETSITVTNASTASSTTAAQPATIKATPNGIALAVECSTVSGTGSMKNTESGGEMIASGEGQLTFSGCIVELPAGKGCTVSGGEVKTNVISGTTQGQGAAIKFTPKVGTDFASITIDGCGIPINGTYAVTGSLVVAPTGATLTTTHDGVTTANTLKLGGVKAGLSASFTVKGENGSALTVT